MQRRWDVIVVGGGHNGLVAAAYLARAGLSVCVLERLDTVGGAAVSAYAFEGMDARLSRYSYLVSLLPQRILDDLGLRLELRRRRYSSYTPLPGSDRGLLIDTLDADATASSFDRLGAGADAAVFERWGADLARLAAVVWPSLTEPLVTREEMRTRLGDDALWREIIERPVGESIERRFADDTVRGVVATDALIGTFASLADPGLQQNVCLLYHLIGQGTGDWDVPVGGMGALTAELARAAREAGVEIVTGAAVVAVDPGDGATDATVRAVVEGGEQTLVAGRVLSGASPHELARLLGDPPPPPAEGAQVKVNLLLSRLPRLRDESVSPELAFGGTFHIHEGYQHLERAHAEAEQGRIPAPLPAEVYCHSLTDPSILSPELQESGAQTLTLFGLHTPHRLGASRDDLQRAALESLDSVLAEPIAPLLLRDASDRPCVETKTTADLEDGLRLPGGNIFHGALAWPFVEDDEPLDTPAQRWGVATAHPRVLLCGSGSRRGGAVSGLGGFAAAQAVLESLESVGGRALPGDS
ncbi:phytoene desaturase family protein [Cnuibacter sp. UC19_7]|uniref:phytoene desaturase family protein n=1 Tax=Cnuibacter sp. UC19_7 TaxID=3350166 RepID=UPI0036733F09